MEVKGYGLQKGAHVTYRGVAYDMGYIGRLKLEIFAKDEKVEHQATFNKTFYIRKSTWRLQLTHGIDFLWDAIYYKEDNMSDWMLYSDALPNVIVNELDVNTCTWSIIP